MLTPTLLAATAAGSSSLRRTSCGTIDCHAGATMAAPASIRNVNSSSVSGVTSSSQTSAANSAETTTIALSATISSRRLSTMSASAPAGSANRNIGRLVATWTSDTISGSMLELGHQPARGRAVHPRADVGDDGRRPEHGVGRVAKRAPGRAGCFRRDCVLACFADTVQRVDEVEGMCPQGTATRLADLAGRSMPASRSRTWIASASCRGPAAAHRTQPRPPPRGGRGRSESGRAREERAVHQLTARRGRRTCWAGRCRIARIGWLTFSCESVT